MHSYFTFSAPASRFYPFQHFKRKIHLISTQYSIDHSMDHSPVTIHPRTVECQLHVISLADSEITCSWHSTVLAFTKLTHIRYSMKMKEKKTQTNRPGHMDVGST